MSLCTRCHVPSLFQIFIRHNQSHQPNFTKNPKNLRPRTIPKNVPHQPANYIPYESIALTGSAFFHLGASVPLLTTEPPSTGRRLAGPCVRAEKMGRGYDSLSRRPGAAMPLPRAAQRGVGKLFSALRQCRSCRQPLNRRARLTFASATAAGGIIAARVCGSLMRGLGIRAGTFEGGSKVSGLMGFSFSSGGFVGVEVEGLFAG